MHNDDRFLATTELLVFLISHASCPFISFMIIKFKILKFSSRVSHFDYVHFIHAKSNDDIPLWKYLSSNGLKCVINVFYSRSLYRYHAVNENL